MSRSHWICLITGFAGILASCAASVGDPKKGEEIFLRASLGTKAAPGCSSCHSLEPGQVKVGPSLAGVGRRAASRISSSVYTGQAQTEAGYLRESILEPNAFVVEGFDAGIMFGGFADALSESELVDLVAFLQTLE
jgi:nitric oxide reductase subunit C